ncbi:MAG TPA: TonB-dependent receptor [Gemmatimonadaceae bacterium]|nr:TonB-dependent receptor [Gemmatimonadaceae bacterium]
MRRIVCVLALAASPSVVFAQQRQTQRADSAARADSARREARSLSTVNIVAAPVDRSQPVSTTQITASVIRSTPANSTWDLLRQTAGLEVHQQGQGPGFASDASVRGFSSDHSTDLALWIDGVPVNEPINGHSEGYNDFSELFTDAVQTIDVTKGPTNPLFGNFALAGVVNVRTIDRMRGSEVHAQAGSYGRAAATVMTGFDHGARGGGVFGVHYEHDDGFRPHGGDNLVQGHGRVVHELGHGVSIDGGTELYAADWNSAGFLGADQFARREYGIVSNPTDGGFKRRAQERLSLQVLRGAMRWRTTAYTTQGRWQLFLTIPPAGGQFEGSGSQTEEEDFRYGTGLTSALTWTLPRGELTVGTEGRWDHAQYENYYTTGRARDSVNARVTARQLSGAVFVRSYANLTDRLRVDVGARADIFDTRSRQDLAGESRGSSGVFSPKVGAAYRLGGGVSAYGNVSRGFRSTDGVIFDPSLSPITAWDYEGGLKYAGHGATASATLFRMDVSDEQTFNPLTGEANNGGSSRRQGLELQGSGLVGSSVVVTGDWTFNDARYTHLTIVSEDGGDPPADVSGLRVYNTAKYVGTGAVQYTPGGLPWSVKLSGTWMGPYSPFDEPGTVLGAYGLMHASVSTTVDGARVDVGVRNLLDRAYPELVAGGLVSPGQPRALFVQLRRSF